MAVVRGGGLYSYQLRAWGHLMKKPEPPQRKEMIEGEEAFERFQNAMRSVLRVPKSALSPSPFGKSKRRTSEAARDKA